MNANRSGMVTRKILSSIEVCVSWAVAHMKVDCMLPLVRPMMESSAVVASSVGFSSPSGSNLICLNSVDSTCACSNSLRSVAQMCDTVVCCAMCRVACCKLPRPRGSRANAQKTVSPPLLAPDLAYTPKRSSSTPRAKPAENITQRVMSLLWWCQSG